MSTLTVPLERFTVTTPPLSVSGVVMRPVTAVVSTVACSTVTVIPFGDFSRITPLSSPFAPSAVLRSAVSGVMMPFSAPGESRPVTADCRSTTAVFAIPATVPTVGEASWVRSAAAR